MPVLNDADTGKVVVAKAARLAKFGRQGERTDDALLDAIYGAVQDRPHIKSAALYRELLGDKDLAPLLPAERAFRGHVADARERIERGTWSPVDADDDEARLVLPVIGRMREVDKPYRERIARLLADETTDPRGRAILANQMERMEASNLSPYWPTPRVAKWIARLRRWLPDLEGAGDYILLATWYAAREARNAPTDDLDARMAAIAARHWQGEEEGK